MDKPITITAHQAQIIDHAYERGVTSSGRYGWYTQSLKRLETLGLVRCIRRGHWDADWQLTALGRAFAKPYRAHRTRS